jgi:hypothetical protein
MVITVGIETRPKEGKMRAMTASGQYKNCAIADGVSSW